ncbi:hypothetical protein niasHT_013823 [Heterodera trifolii]|uniref:Uncharacterized protein n=1 Tax=Heterodera trifolii TaxID=157864 RepID=A0ABD2KTJ4_9BILA
MPKRFFFNLLTQGNYPNCKPENAYICDVDPATGEPESNDLYDEVYALEPVDVGLADFLLATAPKGASFTTAWDALKEEGHETEESYALSNVHTLEGGQTKIIGIF